MTTTELTVATTSPPPTPIYHEVWFIVVVTMGAIVLSVVLVGLICKCCCRRTMPYAYTREQIPVPLTSPRKPPPYSAHVYDDGSSVKEDTLDKLVSKEGSMRLECTRFVLGAERSQVWAVVLLTWRLTHATWTRKMRCKLNALYSTKISFYQIPGLTNRRDCFGRAWSSTPSNSASLRNEGNAVGLHAGVQCCCWCRVVVEK